MKRVLAALAAVSLALAAGCERGDSDNLRDAYERMMAQAEQRAAEAPPAQPAEAVPAEPAAEPPAEPGTLPIDTLPRAPEPEEPAPPPEVRTEDTMAPVFEGTAGTQERAAAGGTPVRLRDVRTAEHDGFDRIVFEFDTAVPGYRVEYVDRPIQECGTGRSIPVSGGGWLRVRLDPANASVATRNRPLDHGVVQQLVLTCDSGGRVEWVIAAAGRAEYRLLQLSEPARLVIDVVH